MFGNTHLYHNIFRVPADVNKMGFIIRNTIHIKNLFLPCLKVQNLVLLNSKNFCVAAQQNAETNKQVVPIPQASNDQRALCVAVIGVPNVGKSTFINNIINHRVCPTSCKVHTTRKTNSAIFTSGNTQLVFHDTPGLVTQQEIRKHNLEQSFKSAYRHAIQNADMIAVLHDASNNWARNELHPTVIDTLKAYPTMPSILILNKVDVLKSKRKLLDTIRIITNGTLCVQRSNSVSGKKFKSKDTPNEIESTNLLKREKSWSHFSEVFLISAITGNGLNEVQDYFLNAAKPKQWQYSSDIFTNAEPEALIVDSVRARLLDYLPQEIPYNLKCELEFYSTQKNTIYASVQVICPSARIERLICGESNGKLRQITERVTSDLVETFGKATSLTISTTSKKEN